MVKLMPVSIAYHKDWLQGETANLVLSKGNKKILQSALLKLLPVSYASPALPDIHMSINARHIFL